MIDRILVDLQPAEGYISLVKSTSDRNRMRLDLRSLIGHLCASDSPIHLQTDMSDDRQFKRILRVAGGAVRADPDFGTHVEALILGTMRAGPIIATPRHADTGLTPSGLPAKAAREAMQDTGQPSEGRIVTLKPGGAPIYPALSDDPSSPPGKRFGGGKYLDALLPRPVDPDVATAESWLRGNAWHPEVINIILDEPDNDLIDDILELETDLDRRMKDILERPGLRAAQDPESCAMERDWLLKLQGKPTDKVPGFERIVLSLLRRHQPAEYSLIHAMAPALSLGKNVSAMLDGARTLAAGWLEQEAWVEPDHPYNPMGSICGHDRLTPDTVLEHAAFVHMFCGEPLARALVDSLLEFRMALLERHLDDNSPWLRIDRMKSILMEDPQAHLDDYTDADPDADLEM